MILGGRISRSGSRLLRGYGPSAALVQRPRGLSSTVSPAVERLGKFRFPGAPESPRTNTIEFISPKSRGVIPTTCLMNDDGVLDETTYKSLGVTDEEVVTWYKNMLFVNALDSIMQEAQRQGRISFYMASAGEEAIMVGSSAALNPGDVITCQYRETGVFKQRGFVLRDFMSQLFSNKNDPGKGRNMPCHYSGRAKVNVHAVASTLGTQIPHATGAAYALKMDELDNPSGNPKVAAAYFGDGAASEGDFHGALNLAATMGCPVIFICRNNGFAISTPTSEQYRGDGIASRGAGYGIETLRVDGTDIFAVYAATKIARQRALEGGGQPVLLELMAYRVSHHSTSDDSFAYREQSDTVPWVQKNNPIVRLGHWLESRGLWDGSTDVETRKRIRREILEELAIAEREKKSKLSSIFDDVYEKLSEEQESQKEELRRLLTKYPAEYDTEEHDGGLDGL